MTTNTDKRSPTVEKMLARAAAKRAAAPKVDKAQVLADLASRDAAGADVIACPCCAQPVETSAIPEDDQTVRALVDRFLRNRDRDAVETLRPATAAAMRQRLQRPRAGE